MQTEHSAGGISAVIGIGNTDWRDDYKAVRAGEVPTDAYGYGAIALSRALADAGIDKSEVDGLITAPYTPVERAAELYGINPRWAPSSYVAEPLHIFDYCLINDGGVALIIAEKERAKRITERPVTIAPLAGPICTTNRPRSSHG